MHTVKKTLPICLLLTFASCATQSDQPTEIDKSNLPENDIYHDLHIWGLENSSPKYDNIKTKYEQSKKPWSGDFWPTSRGGLLYRWLDTKQIYTGVTYKHLSKADIQKLKTEEIAKLSPAEKYDIWQENWENNPTKSFRSYHNENMIQPAIRSEEYRINNTNSRQPRTPRIRLSQLSQLPSWIGICNGWGLASLYENEPQKPVKVQNSLKQTITFYPDDIKALLSQIYFDYQPKAKVINMGRSCYKNAPLPSTNNQTTACNDIHPVALHLALKQFSEKGVPILMDKENGPEVWNQPIYSYSIKFSKPRRFNINEYTQEVNDKHQTHNPTAIVKKLVNVNLTVKYGIEYDLNPNQPEKTPAPIIQSITYDYILELDSTDRIVGGAWKKNSPMIDFIWRPVLSPKQEIPKTLGSNYPLKYAKILDLLKESSQ